MEQTAGVATDIWMGTGPFTATAWTSLGLPPHTAWAMCGRYGCGMTTKVFASIAIAAILHPADNPGPLCPPSIPCHHPGPHPTTTSTGLSPAWFLQHIIVRDLQNAHSTFFLVNDWLSVETEANGGLVEKEVLAASKAQG